MVALDRISNAPYQCTTSLHPISEVANLEKKVPLEWVNADHTAMLPEFLAYAMPLIQAELTPSMLRACPTISTCRKPDFCRVSLYLA